MDQVCKVYEKQMNFNFIIIINKIKVHLLDFVHFTKLINVWNK